MRPAARALEMSDGQAGGVLAGSRAETVRDLQVARALLLAAGGVALLIRDADRQPGRWLEKACRNRHLR